MENKGIGLEKSSSVDSINIKKRTNHLLLIGIDKYNAETITHLKNAESDCLKLERLLTDKYEFEEKNTKHLFNYDATLKGIGSFIIKNTIELTESDNLVIFYSGHGYFNKLLEKGYWIPSDGEDDDITGLSHFANDVLLTYLSKCNAHHIVLIVDSCFAGSMILEESRSIDDRWEKKRDSFKSRWYLSSGRLEYVSDGHPNEGSPFMRALINFLEKNDEIVSINRINDAIDREFIASNIKQSPLCRSLKILGDDGGEFFFIPKTTRLDQSYKSFILEDENSIREKLREGSKYYFRSLKRGRFAFLNISELILPEIGKSIIQTKVKHNRRKSPLLEISNKIWKEKKLNESEGNFFLMGEGGMGKTVGCLKIWEEYLDDNNAPIPIFIPLNEYNNFKYNENSANFIFDFIQRNYLGYAEVTVSEINRLWDVFRRKVNEEFPSVILILDGFNEISVEKRLLLIELQNIVELAWPTQIIVSSRYGIIDSWATNFEKVHLLTLTKNQIQNYLASLELPNVLNRKMYYILKNPMMLTIYAGTNKNQLAYSEDPKINYIKDVSNEAEIIWNFFELQLIKAIRFKSEAEQYFTLFLVRMVLPYLGYKMECNGSFDLVENISSLNVENSINEAFNYFNNKEFLIAYPIFKKHYNYLKLGDLSEDWANQTMRFVKVETLLVESLRILVKEDHSFRFLHQNFRDTMSAIHILNEIKIVNCVNSNFPKRIAHSGIGDRIIPKNILSNLAGLLHVQKNKEEILKLLDNLRNRSFDDYSNWSILNILEILNIQKGHLAGINLSFLDLRRISLYNKVFSSFENNSFIGTNFENSLFSINSLIPYGHEKLVRSIKVIDQENKIAISVGWDKCIIVWNLHNGQFIKKLKLGSDLVYQMVYKSSGSQIILGFRSGKIVIKDILTGAYQHLISLQAPVSYLYLDKKEKFLFAGTSDGIILCYDFEESRIIQAIQLVNSPIVYFREHEGCYYSVSRNGFFAKFDQNIKIISNKNLGFYVESIVFYPGGFKFWFSTPYNSIYFCEKYESNPIIFKTTKGSVTFLTLTPDHKKIVYIHSGSQYCEMDIESRTNLKEFDISRKNITVIDFYDDSKKIIFGTYDREVKTFDLISGEFLHEFEGLKEEHIIFKGINNKLLFLQLGANLRYFDPDENCFLQTVFVNKKMILFTFINEFEIMCISKNRKEVFIYNLQKQKIKFRTELTIMVLDVVVSKKNKIAYFYSRNGYIIKYCLVHNIVRSKDRLINNSQILSFVLSPNQEKILVGLRNGEVIIFDALSLKIDLSIQAHEKGVLCIDVHQSNKRFLTGSADSSLKEWDLNGELINNMTWHKSKVIFVKYVKKLSNNNLTFLSIGIDKKLCMYFQKRNKLWCIRKTIIKRPISFSLSEDHNFLYIGSDYSEFLKFDLHKLDIVWRSKILPGFYLENCNFNNSRWEKNEEIFEFDKMEPLSKEQLILNGIKTD